MKIKTIMSFEEYISYTESYKGLYYFRGQADASWTVLPTLFRPGCDKSLRSERDTIQSSLSECGASDPIEALFYAQHYGKPTRICDLTISNLNALYFASTGDMTGVVYVFDKNSAVCRDGFEMQLFSSILTGDEYNLSDFLLVNSDADAISILTRNYIVNYKNLGYTNSRAFRQGGTGLIFGFGYENNSVIPIGNTDISDLIVEKIIIPASAKKDILAALQKIGITKDILFAGNGEDYNTQEVTLTQTSLKTNVIYDSTPLNKVNAEYQVSSIFFSRDNLVGQITAQYKSLLERYGSNARIWTFFYHDETDKYHCNWICRGTWKKDTQYEIVWSKDYLINRMWYINEEVSRDEALDRMFSLAEKITELYNRVVECMSREEFSVDTLFALAIELCPISRRISKEASAVPFTDVEADRTVATARNYIDLVDLLIGDMEIFSKRSDMNQKQIRWLARRYQSDCEKARLNYMKAAKALGR